MLQPELTAQVKNDFDRQGYVAIRGFLGGHEVERVRREVARYASDLVPHTPNRDVYFEVPGDPASMKQLIRMNQYNDYFGELLADRRFAWLGELLLGVPVVGKNIQWFNKPPGASRATPPHQDGYYLMLEPNEAVTMWLALDEVGEDNGCVRYVTGSHLRGLPRHERTDTLGFSQGIPDYGAEDRRLEAAVTASPGDLLVHHSLTIHRAEANGSDRKRRALGLLYYSARAVEDAEGIREYARALDARVSNLSAT